MTGSPYPQCGRDEHNRERAEAKLIPTHEVLVVPTIPADQSSWE
jgi:hypothetical protein